MREITVNVYQYKELNDKAKEKARNWYLAGSDFDFEWDDLQSDAKEIGLLLTSWEYNRYLNAVLDLAPESVCDKIIENHGEGCQTYKTAQEYRAKFTELNKLYEAGDASFDDKYEELKEEFLKSISEDYRIIADNQYEYTQSDEYIEEAMEANEYEFLENGTRF